MANKAFVVVQDLTYTEREYGLGVTVEYVDDTLLSVSVVNKAITVHLNTGVSTATDVKAAIEAYEYSSRIVSVVVSGTGSTVQVAAGVVSTSGDVAEGAEAYFSNGTTVPLTASFVLQEWHFHGNLMVMVNDETSGTKTVAYSYDGINLHGTLTPGQSITMDIRQSVTGLWLKYVTAAPAYRLSVK